MTRWRPHQGIFSHAEGIEYTDKVRKGPAKANVLMYTSAYGDKQVCKS